MHFEILGEIAEAETIATDSGIRELARLRKRYGRGRWRKRKGVAMFFNNWVESNMSLATANSLSASGPYM
jgi:hypothetical protein